MKRILTILFALSSLISYAQFTGNQTLGNSKNKVIAKGGLEGTLGLINGRFYDTVAANLTPIKYEAGAQIFTVSDNAIWIRNSAASRWIFSDNGIPNGLCRGLISGGVVTWTGLLNFGVTSATYCINNRQYISNAGAIALDAANPLQPRIDIIALDTTGAIVKITGVASTSPAAPQINPARQLYLTSVLINASATTPAGVRSIIIWNENTGTPEYTGSATLGTISFTSTASVFNGTVSTEAGSFTGASRNVITYSGGFYSFDSINVLKFFVKLKSRFADTANLYVTLRRNGSSTTLPILLDGNTGFSKNNDSTFQNISIPITNFSFLTSVSGIDGIRISTEGSNANGFFIDYITLNGGISNTINYYGLTDIYRKPATDSIFKILNGAHIYAFTDSSGLKVAGNGGNLQSDSIVMYDPTCHCLKLMAYSKDSFQIRPADTPFIKAVPIGPHKWELQANLKTINGQSLYDTGNISIPSADSSIFSTNYRRDTAISNLRSEIGTKADTANMIKFNFTSLKNNDYIKYDSVNQVWKNTAPTLGGGSGWGLTGNAIAGTTAYIGTIDSAAFRIRTKDIERTSIDSTGKITHNGSLRFNGEDIYVSFDGTASQRIGFTKKTGNPGQMTYGSTYDFNISQSNAVDILPSNTFTSRFAVKADGTVYVANKLAIGAALPASNTGYLYLNSFNDVTLPDIRFTIWNHGISNIRNPAPTLTKMGFLIADGTSTGKVNAVTIYGDTSLSVGSTTQQLGSAFTVNSGAKGAIPAPRMTTAQRDNNIQKSVTTITITNGGSGYTVPPTVTLSAGITNANAAPTATATATISGGIVTAITVTNGGAYLAVPTVSFSGGGGGSGAAATAAINPAEGIEIYNLTLHQKQYFNGTSWISY